jgi:transcriptional regulator with XRE-family HTH domain
MSEKIKEARKAAGLTQQQMSDEMGIPKRTIENWEAGSRSCPEWTEKLIVAELKRIKERKEMKKWIMIEENYGGDNWPKVFDTQEEANKVAVKTWDSLTAAEKKKKHVFVIDVTEDDISEDAIEEYRNGEYEEFPWECWEDGGHEEGNFDSDRADVTVKSYPTNIDVFVRGNSVSISTDGLSIEDELKEDPDTDKETIVSNWVEADLERIQDALGSELFFNEKEKLEEELESYYYRYKDK